MTRFVRTMCRAALILVLTLSPSAPESQAATRRSCHRTCKRFARQCMVTNAKPGRCQRILHRLDKCKQRFADVACEATTTTTTSSTTTTTIPGSGVVINVDEARASTETLPLEGGTLTATGADGTVYSLTIPPGALLLETAITMTPIVSISGGDLPGGSVLGVDLKPSGLRLYEFADLSIAPPQLGPTANIAGFSYEGDGDDLHRYPAALDAGRILLHVIHFSGAGAKICVELCPPPIVPPPPPITESQLEQLIASLDPHHPFYASRLAELLHGYYDLFIAPDLALMEQSCEYATSRIPKVLAWSRTNQILLAEEGFEGQEPDDRRLARSDRFELLVGGDRDVPGPEQCLPAREPAADRTTGPAPGRRSRALRAIQGKALLGPLERDHHVRVQVRRGCRL